MRPPEFTGGNIALTRRKREAEEGFNEAAGIHRRKHRYCEAVGGTHDASMRPPEFTGGNPAFFRQRSDDLEQLQ